jgi:hypothetical protein
VSPVLLIANGIPIPFRFPILGVGSGRSASLPAGVFVPEAPINEDDLPARAKNHIWNARQCLIVKTVTETKAVKRLADL